MEVRKWEDLNMDCLVNAFGRLGVESMLFDVPFVCKSWYNATLDPLCWQHLDFPREISHSFKSRLVDKYGLERFDTTGLIKFVVNRSSGYAVSLVLPSSSTKETLICAAEGCPALKFLTLSCLLENDTVEASFVASLIRKWRNLQMLRLGSGFDTEEILTQVSLHCKDFVDFGHFRLSSSNSISVIRDDEIWVIVTLLPNLEYLDLRRTNLHWLNLERILKRCKKLVHLDVRDCIGFEVNEKILKLARVQERGVTRTRAMMKTVVIFYLDIVLMTALMIMITTLMMVTAQMILISTPSRHVLTKDILTHKEQELKQEKAEKSKS
ncbi:F-box/LRR-repeat protein At3g48880-like [Cornus florida]|uniref:F-box/LRR-repeat protein At3g48880-like n=1 Tax=Cornus florida TaxID=4283 RepID=UPI00289FCC9C|nr:F-box/LRR-repeat protein At3g48880-like [Cornus florida]